MLEEKLKEAIVAELRRQAANQPQSLRVESSPDLVVNGKVDGCAGDGGCRVGRRRPLALSSSPRI